MVPSYEYELNCRSPKSAGIAGIPACSYFKNQQSAILDLALVSDSEFMELTHECNLR